MHCTACGPCIVPQVLGCYSKGPWVALSHIKNCLRSFSFAVAQQVTAQKSTGLKMKTRLYITFLHLKHLGRGPAVMIQAWLRFLGSCFHAGFRSVCLFAHIVLERSQAHTEILHVQDELRVSVRLKCDH